MKLHHRYALNQLKQLTTKLWYGQDSDLFELQFAEDVTLQTQVTQGQLCIIP